MNTDTSALEATERQRLRIAIQKSGRLADKTMELFSKCGLEFDFSKDRLLRVCTNFPVDLMLVRDDDIPEYVVDGVCDLGVVGENVIQERYLSAPDADPNCLTTLLPLGFGGCRLSLAYADGSPVKSAPDLQGKRVATSYPVCLQRYLDGLGIAAHIVELSGSVEIAPALKIADAICDLVSTGATLRSNGLREGELIFKSQACLIKPGRPLPPQRAELVARLMRRIEGVMRAARSKYVMMNAPADAIDAVRAIIPGLEEPSVMPVGIDGKRVAIHAVAIEEVFWETLEKLKAVGASSILVLPIEKVVL
jgi:ATP phosphoribosyltransferase